jgi:hypothetical protein
MIKIEASFSEGGGSVTLNPPPDAKANVSEMEEFAGALGAIRARMKPAVTENPPPGMVMALDDPRFYVGPADAQEGRFRFAHR